MEELGLRLQNHITSLKKRNKMGERWFFEHNKMFESVKNQGHQGFGHRRLTKARKDAKKGEEF